MIDRFVNSVFRAHSVQAYAHRAVPTPAWDIIPLQLGRGERVERVAALLPTLRVEVNQAMRRAGAASTEIVISLREQPLSLEVLRPVIPAIPWPGPALHMEPHRALLGVTYDATGKAERLEWELSDPATPHVLVAGITGAGKTFLLRSALLSLLWGTSPAALALFVIDGVGGANLMQFRAFPHLHPGAYSQGMANATEVVAHVAHLAAIDPPARPERLLLVVDEVQLIALQRQDRIIVELQRLATTGRNRGVHLVLATQRPTAEAISTLIRAQMGLRLVGAVSTKEESKIASGRAELGAELLPRSKGLFYAVEGSAVTRFQVPAITANDMLAHRQATLERWCAVVPPTLPALPPLPESVRAVDSQALANTFARFTDPDTGGLREGGITAGLRSLLRIPEGQPLPGGRQYQAARAQLATLHQQYLEKL